MPNDYTRGLMGNELRDEYARNFLDIAIKDIYASEILYNKHLYPQAVFLLEQACEKLVKVIAIFFNFTDMSKLQRDIGHAPHELAKMIRSRYYPDVVLHSSNTLPLFPDICQDDSSADSEIAQLSELPKEIEGKIQKWIAEYFVYISSQESKEIYSETELLQIVNLVNDNLTTINKAVNDVTVIPGIGMSALNSVPIHLHIAATVLFTFHLTLITEKHAIKARYPDIDVRTNTIFSPGDYYDANLPLIKIMGNIYQPFKSTVLHLNDSILSIRELESILRLLRRDMEENNNEVPAPENSEMSVSS